MKQTYTIHGMTCSGCRSHVEEMLRRIAGVTNVFVNLEKGEATVETEIPISIEAFKYEFKNDGDRYGIMPLGYKQSPSEIVKNSEKQGTGIYYCPMHCEGEKTYAQPGDCPICGMDLVPLMEDISVEQKAHQKLLNKFKIAVGFTAPIFLIAMSEMLPENPLYKILELKYWNWLQFGLSLPVIFYATWMFFERAYRSIATWNLNMFTLIGIGAGVAWVYSLFGMLIPDFFPPQFKSGAGTVHIYFEAATVILTLVLLGQLLEARAHSKTSNSVKELLKLAPNFANRLVDGKEEKIAIDKIKINDLLRVKPGAKIPVDGVITEGESTIDESMITGEPIPVSKITMDKVISGTINGKRSFVMKAEKVGADTLLAQIVDMVKKASRSKAPIQKLVDKISEYFVPIVVIISVMTFFAWAIYGPQPAYVYALVNGIAVLIIACPCALGLATPMSIMVGVGRGAGFGVLIKNAEALELMDKIDTLIIDKTGTVTEGIPSVEKIVTVGGDFDEGKVLQYLVSLNRFSEHPLAEATLKYGNEHNTIFLGTESFHSLTGKGVTGIVNNKKVVIGNEKMMEESDVIISEKLKDEVFRFQELGKTVPFIAIDGAAVGYVVIGDKIKKGSKKAIAVLQDYGIHVIMLTGDNVNTARAVAEELNLKHFRAGMLPQDKLNEVARMQARGSIVAMAGDGVNDAPALAKSDVGIAMGSGTDVAIESAAITLVKGNLNGIIKAYDLSKKVMKNIKQNLFFALVYNTLGVPIAAGVLFPFFEILLSPMIAALAMSFSSVSVITNALRLKNISIG